MNAPDSSSCTFWAQIPSGEPPADSIVATSAVYGGQTTASIPFGTPRPSSAAMNRSASPAVLCIFQLAATSGRREPSRGASISGIGQHLHSR